jgi:uncharacterized protein (DUF4415 family)
MAAKVDHKRAETPDEDNPEWTASDFAASIPFAEAFPAEHAALIAEQAAFAKRPRGRPTKEHPKKNVTFRLDADLIDALRATGDGWQSRVNDVLRRAAGL